MSPRLARPKSRAECIDLVVTLGFVKKHGTGRGKHPEKYIHYEREHSAQGDRPFILITHDYFEELGPKLMKKVQNWGFTREEAEAALKGIKPTLDMDNDINTEIDTEPESA